MNNFGRLWLCAAALGGLASCGDGTVNNQSQAGSSVTVELPEPATPAVTLSAANAAAANLATRVTDDAEDAAPVEKADAPAATPPRKAEEPARKAERPEKAATDAVPEDRPEADAPGESMPLPLPAAVVVRTIEKIGFPCGSIVASSRIEGAAGSSDYRIRCSSGASYRASNRTGRYRFSKAD